MPELTITSSTKRPPWAWVPSLYFVQGIPFVVVNMLSVILYKNFNLSNEELALYTSWLYFPFVIKPLWSPFIDMFKNKRYWIVIMQSIVACLLACVALCIPTDWWLQATIVLFILIAFHAATHDIAADGFYMLALKSHEQAEWVGVRSMFFRIAIVFGQGGLVMLAGELTTWTGQLKLAWSLVFGLLSILFLILAAYHFWALPRPSNDVATQSVDVLKDYWKIMANFFHRKEILAIIAFLLFYRFGEAQLLKLASPFLLDPISKGGLGLSTTNVGFVYGTMGIISLTAGGILGGLVISKYGLKQCLWPMALAINVPHLAYVFLAYTQPSNLLVITACVCIEQFCYGLGFTAYMLAMIMFADGPHKTAHYAVCTGFMAASMMLPGFISGKLQSYLGYPHFFVWICVCALATFAVCTMIKIDPQFGKKSEA